jgi:hypothetical protein
MDFQEKISTENYWIILWSPDYMTSPLPSGLHPPTTVVPSPLQLPSAPEPVAHSPAYEPFLQLEGRALAPSVQAACALCPSPLPKLLNLITHGGEYSDSVLDFVEPSFISAMYKTGYAEYI